MQVSRSAMKSAASLGARSGWLLGTAFTIFGGLAAHAQPPTSGAIMQSTQPAIALPTPPPEVIALPAPSIQASNNSIEIPVSKLVIKGNKLLPTSKLQTLVQPAEGRKLTLGQLRDYVQRITSAYQAAGYQLAYAYLPPQQVRNGVITIDVMEPRYDQVQVVGAKRIRPGTVLRTLGIKPGEAVNITRLNRSLLLLDQTPGIQATGKLLPGSQPGTSTLQASTQDTNLVSGNIYDNNYGNRYTGANAIGFNLSLNDPFGYGSSSSVNGMIAPAGNIQTAGFELDSPYIWNGLRAGFYGSYTYYRLGGTFTDLEQRGHANQLGTDVTYPLLLEPGRTLNARFDLVQNWLGQTTLSTGFVAQQSITVERLTLSGAARDRFYGVTTGSLALTNGNLAVGGADAKQADREGPKAAGAFQYALIQLQRNQTLPYGFTLTTALSGQLSTKNLDSSQQLYLGGAYGVMSYMPSSGGGDQGYLLNTHLSHGIPLPARVGGDLQLSLLVQTGTVWVNHNNYGGFQGHNRITESGMGAELDYNWGHWSGQLAYVYQLGASDPADASTHSGQAWFQISRSF